MRFPPRNLGIGTVIMMGIVVLAAGALFWDSTVRRQLQKPVMDGQPITFWLEQMGAGDDRDEIRRRLVLLGPSVTPPLLADLEDKPSQLKVKVSRLLGGRFPAVTKWLWRRKYASRWMAAYTLGGGNK